MEDLKPKETTTKEAKDKIVDRTFEIVKEFAHKGRKKITDRLREIEREADLEKIIYLNLAAIATTGAVLSYISGDKRWAIMPAAAALILGVDTLFGITSKVPFLRRLGLRLKDEILHERYALKALRGDFKNTAKAEVVWDAAE